MQLLKDDFDGILQNLRAGGVILMPTDTIWGLVCDSAQPEAIQRIYEIKDQALGTGMVLLVKDLQMLKAFVPNLHPRLETLLIYHTRPLTLLYPNTQNLSEKLQGPDGLVALRITFDPLCPQYNRASWAPNRCGSGLHFRQRLSEPFWRNQK